MQLNESRERLLGEILDRAATDQMFRGQLIEHPKQAIYAEFGVSIPDTYRLRFVERDPEVNALFVLPDLQAGKNGDGELGDDELDYVCGGSGGDGDDGW